MKIPIEEYRASWAGDFLEQKDIIGKALADLDPAIEHVGSTSIPGLCAKPTIDVLAGLQDESLLDRTISPMVGKGYTYFKKYESDMPFRRLFSKLKTLTGKAPPEIIDVHDEFIRGQEFLVTANVHIVVKDTSHWQSHLAFRDFLRTHPQHRDEYGQLKKELSKREFKDTNDYNAAKDGHIKKIQLQALAWYHNQKRRDESG
jgi:GrpB-like predicted nucleotidyltransferase (UPF0157 family)